MEKTEIIIRDNGTLTERFIRERDLKAEGDVLDELTADVTRKQRNVMAIGCTGEAQTSNRQLVSANLMAAALAEHLFVLWNLKAPRMDAETVTALPYQFVANLSKLETHK